MKTKRLFNQIVFLGMTSLCLFGSVEKSQAESQPACQKCKDVHQACAREAMRIVNYVARNTARNKCADELVACGKRNNVCPASKL